ncbi:hypothetical protein QW131_17410 [Roseibium salinum]|nr:hypothetical protein [Roseibium salinum]
MCGIAGISNPAVRAEALAVDIRSMLAHIGHRGPDGAGYVVDHGFAMGAVRLAILDPPVGRAALQRPVRQILALL